MHSLECRNDHRKKTLKNKKLKVYTQLLDFSNKDSVVLTSR